MKTINSKIKSENIQYKLLKEQKRISDGELEIFTNRVKTIFNKKQYIFTNKTKTFEKYATENYTKTNIKSLKYIINSLTTLKYKDSDNNIFKLEQYMKYMRKDSQGRYYIEDKENEYLKSQDNQRNKKIFSKVNYIDYIYTNNENIERIPAFITITLPSKYHFYRKKYPWIKDSTVLELNPKRGFLTLGATIEESGKLLQVINRYLSKALKTAFKRANITLDYGFIKVLEQHINKSFHLHSLGYFTKEQLEIFYKIFDNLIEKFDLERTDIQEVTRTAAEEKGLKFATPTSYIMKYLLKDQLFGEVRKYCSSFKVFTCTNFQKTNQKELDRLYSYMNNKKESNKENKQLLEKWKKDKTIPLYVQMENYIHNNIEVVYKEVENYDNDYSLKKTIDNKINEYLEEQEKLLKNHKEKYIFKEENLQEVYQNIRENFIENLTFDFIDKITICTDMKKIKKIDYMYNKHNGEFIYSHREIEKTPQIYKIN